MKHIYMHDQIDQIKDSECWMLKVGILVGEFRLWPNPH